MAQFWPKIMEAYILGSTLGIFFFKFWCMIQYNKSSIQNGGISTFWAQKIRQEKFSQFTKIMNFIKSVCINFCVEMF